MTAGVLLCSVALARGGRQGWATGVDYRQVPGRGLGTPAFLVVAMGLSALFLVERLTWPEAAAAGVALAGVALAGVALMATGRERRPGSRPRRRGIVHRA